MMDDETRFWIAQEVAETKEKHDARTLFFRAKRLMGKQPKTLITDGLASYSLACDQVFDGTKHIRKITTERASPQQQQDGANERRNPRQRKDYERIKAQTNTDTLWLSTVSTTTSDRMKLSVAKLQQKHAE